MTKLIWFSISLISILLLLSPPASTDQSDGPTSRRILVLVDDFAIRSSHSIFFNSLQSRGFNLDFKLADDPKISLQRYGKYQYDGLVIFSPSAKQIGGSLASSGVLEFVDSGRDLILAADLNASDLIREIATECGADFDEDRNAVVIDHTSYAVSETEGDHTLIASEEFIKSKAFFGGKEIEAPVLFRGIAHTLNPANNMAVKVLSASPSAYSANPNGNISKPPGLAGSTISLVSIGVGGLPCRRTVMLPVGGGPRDAQNRENNSQKVYPQPIDETMTDGQNSMEALISEIFNNVSSLKTAYMQLQAAHTPYEPEKIQTADKLVIKELMKLSELKHTYRERYPKPTPSSPEDARLVVEIHEQQSLLKTYEVMVKKFQSQIQNSDSEIRQLEQQIQDARQKKIRLEKTIRQREMFSQGSKEIESDDSYFDGKLTPILYYSAVSSVQKGIHDFSNALVKKMREAGWDIKAAAKIIEPKADYTQNSHRKYAFHSYICLKMFHGFQEESFLFENDDDHSRGSSRSQEFFIQFKTIRTMDPLDMVSRNPTSVFGRFCKMKYLFIMHSKLEVSIFGHLDQRDLVMSGGHPRTPFYLSFIKLAKQVWILHRLTHSFVPKVKVFQVRKGSEFSNVYMENVVQHDTVEAPADDSADTKKKLTVAFMTLPGFVVKGTIIKSLVYLDDGAKCSKNE